MAVIASSLATSLIPVTDQSQIADARRHAAMFTRMLGFDETQRGRAEIVASEMATNVWLHGRGGYVLMRTNGLTEGLELLAVDSGPGMANVDECLRDGFSTAGTAGNGLGAIRRLAQVFDIYSRPGKGTVVLAQCLRSAAPAPARFVVGAVCQAVAGETECGDAWSAALTGRTARVSVADGLGHGPDAGLASNGAIRAIAGCVGQPLTATLETTHRAIAGTRGAALAICDIEADARTVRYAGIGNIAGAIITGPDMRSMVSHNGIVGHQQRKVQEFSYPWSPDALLIMHSDGLQTRWSLDALPGLASRHPSVIAAVLHREHARGRDDTTVVVLKESR